VKIKTDGKSRIFSIYSGGILHSKTSLSIVEDYLRFKANLPKGTPEWLKCYFDGVRDCLHDKLYEHLHFAYEINGKLYSIHKSHLSYYEKHGLKPSDLCGAKGGHYWFKNDKPFFVAEKES
ncbi:unnamed protein product, partial [marine sediment metagenome]